MHEMSITEGIIEICQSHAGGQRVVSVDVEIGELGSIVPEAVEFCFEACSIGTSLEGARLNIIRVPGMAHCLECGAEMGVTSLYAPCERCGSYRLQIVAGEEMRVREIEVE